MPSFSFMPNIDAPQALRIDPEERSALVVTAIAVLVAMLACAVYWAVLVSSHNEQLRGAEQQSQLRAQQISKALLSQVETLVGGLDFATRSLAEELSHKSPEGFNATVRTVVQSYPQGSILQIAIADRSGKVIYANPAPDPWSPLPANVGDREHFRVHQDNSRTGAADRLFISAPVLGRVSGQWSIQLSRALRRNGEFDGILVISLSPHYISDFFQSIFDSERDVVMLLRQDGRYLARSQGEQAVLGKAVPDSREYLRNNHLMHGTYEAVARVDGIARYYAWSRAQAYPLVINVGLDKDAALAGVQQAIQASRQRNLLGIAIVLGGVLVISWLRLQRSRAKALLRAKDERLAKLVTQVPGAIYQYKLAADGTSSFPYASPGIADIYGFTPDELATNAAKVFDLIHPDDLESVKATIMASAHDLTPWECKYRVGTSTGGCRWLHGYARPERLPDGSVLWHGYLHDITTEQAIQQALHESEERLRLTLDAVRDGLWEWDTERGTLHWDARCYELLGYPDRGFPMGLGAFLDLVHPLDVDRCRIDQAQHLESNRIYRTEFRLRRASGEWLWVESRGQLLPATEHRPARMMGTLSDIGERVTQAQVRRALLDQSAAAIFLATPDRRISHANARAIELFAPNGHALIGKDFRIIHTDEASFAAFGEHYQALRQAGSVRLEWRLRDNRGRVRWFNAHGSLLGEDDPNGSVIWTMLDTDAQHRAMDAQELAQQRLTAIIEQFPGGVLVEDQAEQRIVVANQALCQLGGPGWSPRDLVGRTHAELAERLPADLLVPPPGEDAAPDAWECHLDDGRDVAVERIPLHSAGTPVGLFWFIRDITERKRRETALAALAATDPLTGLANRRTFMARMNDELHEQRRGRHGPSVLVMLDLDHFKRVNDTYGHAAGDRVLQHLAGLMQAALRRDDLAGRLGGEEFAVLLSDTDLDGGGAMAERLRIALETTPARTDTGELFVTASLGVTLFRPPFDSPEDCLARADAALYEAKHRGRNRVMVRDEDRGFPITHAAPVRDA